MVQGRHACGHALLLDPWCEQGQIEAGEIQQFGAFPLAVRLVHKSLRQGQVLAIAGSDDEHIRAAG